FSVQSSFWSFGLFSVKSEKQKPTSLNACQLYVQVGGLQHGEPKKCDEQNGTNPTLFWYKQDGNNNPKFILSCSQFGTVNTEKKYEERFSSKVNSTSNSVPLKIQKLQLSDSAVYYCALQPTVTGNTKTLYKNLWNFKRNLRLKENVLKSNLFKCKIS
uniref:Ig-like domain-containing protein n=1 Tax=Sparus aurata TaxID=8175 RepID=A0A671UEB9_SPAAU